jgi:hypothetical protein
MMRRAAGVAILLFAAAGLLWALTGLVAPDGDNSTGSWSTPPLWSKLREDIDSPDGTVITSSNNPSSPTNDLVFDVTCPADLDTATAANLRVRGRKASGGRDISFAVSWSATAATNFNTGVLTTSLADYASGNQTGLSISKASCDASTVTISPTTSGGGPATTAEIDTVNLDLTYSGATAQAPLSRRMIY